MSDGTYTYTLRRFTKREHYADVTVRVKETASAGPVVCVSPNAFAWLKEVYGPDTCEWPVCHEYRLDALQGILYALTHASPPLDHLRLVVAVTTIKARPPSTGAGDVAYAACFATWKACGLQATHEPEIVDGTIVFPPTQVANDLI